MARADDLSGLFNPGGSGPSQPLFGRQGEIVTFNQVTLQNTVRVGGAIVTDMPVLGVAEAASYTTGAVVSIVVVGSSMAILGRMVTPGTAEAAAAISLMSAQTPANTVVTPQGTTSSGFADLATVGPSVDLLVGPSGRVEVALSCVGSVTATFTAFPPITIQYGMSFAMSGANVRSADTVAAAGASLFRYFQWNAGSPSSGTFKDQVSLGGSFVVEGLTPGLTTFTAKYLSDGILTATFSSRVLSARRL